MLAANAIGRSRDRLAPLARGGLDFSKAAWSCSVLDSNHPSFPVIVRKRSLTKWEVHSGLGAGGHDLHRDGAAFGDATPRVAQPRTFFETLAFGQTKTVEAKGESDGIVDRLRLLAVTTVGGVVGDLRNGNFPDGAGNFLDPTTPEDRRLMFLNSAQGVPAYADRADRPCHPDRRRDPRPWAQHLRRRLSGGRRLPHV
jgi:hypothetical protein